MPWWPNECFCLKSFRYKDKTRNHIYDFLNKSTVVDLSNIAQDASLSFILKCKCGSCVLCSVWRDALGNFYLPRFTKWRNLSQGLTVHGCGNETQQGFGRLDIYLPFLFIRFSVLEKIRQIVPEDELLVNLSYVFAFFLTWLNQLAHVSCFLVGVAAILDFYRETSSRLLCWQQCKLATVLIFSRKQRWSAVDREKETSRWRDTQCNKPAMNPE